MPITIGQRLKATREEQRLTLEKVFEFTRIRIQYLRAIEDDDLSVMPSPVQARGYLRNYTEFLGLDVDEILEELRESNTQQPSEVVIGPIDIQEPLAPELLATNADAPLPDETPPLIKPKPARRKRAGPQPADESAPPPKRKTRKKEDTQLEPEPVVEIQADVVEEPVVVEVPVVDEPLNVKPEPGQEESPQTEDVPSVPVETQPVTNVNDSNWQSWLNRLGAVLAARNKRQTLVVKETAVSENAFKTESSSPTETSPSKVEELVPELEGVESSAQIFKEIGRELRERRELLSLNLEEVERNTRVKAHYLDALERGTMDDLPSTVQTRGMLSNYATFLDLDVDTLLLRYADALQAGYRERNPKKPVRKAGQPIAANLPPMRSFIAGDMIFGVGIVVLLVGFAIWGVSRVMTLQSEQNVNPTAPSISDILLAPPDSPSSTTTPTSDAIESFPGQSTVTVVIPTLNGDVNVQLNLVATERTYMRVIADGEVAFEGRAMPGTAYPFDAQDQVDVLVGNGAAIRVVYNGRDLGLLGSFGQVVNNIYTASGIATPTGMPTSTVTITTTPTRTLVPSATSRFTATPAPSDTPVP